MEWTKSLPMRLVAIAATGLLVVVHRSDRGTWFWIGAALLVLNLVGLVVSLRSAPTETRPPAA